MSENTATITEIRRVGFEAPFIRADDEEQMIYGVAVSEYPVEEIPGLHVILDYDATKRAAAAWAEYGNIREMHQLSAVGVAREITPRDDRRDLFVGAHIVDAEAWQKVKTGVYKAFSVQVTPREWVVEKKDGESKTVRILDYKIEEVSLCDRAKDPNAQVTLWRSPGSRTAFIDLVRGQEQDDTGGNGMSVLNEIWEAVFGDEHPVPEDAEEALDELTRALAPAAVEEDAEDPVDDSPESPEGNEGTGDEGDVIEELARVSGHLSAIRGRMQAMEERLAQVEAQPAGLPVQRRAEAEKPIEERIAELERIIRTQRLDPDAPEVVEVMRLHEQARRGG
jgi:hypothetical protein